MADDIRITVLPGDWTGDNPPNPPSASEDALTLHTLHTAVHVLRASLHAAAERIVELQQVIDAHQAELIQADERWRAQVHRLTAELGEAVAARARGAAERNVLVDALKFLHSAGDDVHDTLWGKPQAEKWFKAMAQVDELFFIMSQQEQK